MLQKMGWSKGKGLGKNEDGSTSHIKVKKKEDSQGLGLDEDIEGTKTLMKNANVFSDILKELNATHGVKKIKKIKRGKKRKSRGDDGEGSSPPKRQLATGAKYKKRMRSKLVSSYDRASLAMILGKRPEDMAKEITSVSSRGRTRSLSFEGAEAIQNAAAAEALKVERRGKKADVDDEPDDRTKRDNKKKKKDKKKEKKKKKKKKKDKKSKEPK